MSTAAATTTIPRDCVLALPRAGGPALLLAGVGHHELERLLVSLGIDPAQCVLGRATIDQVLEEFVPRDEGAAEDDELLDRVLPACLMARRFDGYPPILLSGGTKADLVRILTGRLNYPIGTYAICGARLADCVLVDGWDAVRERRFDAR